MTNFLGRHDELDDEFLGCHDELDDEFLGCDDECVQRMRRGGPH